MVSAWKKVAMMNAQVFQPTANHSAKSDPLLTAPDASRLLKAKKRVWEDRDKDKDK